MNSFNTPAEIYDIWVGNGANKASLPIRKMLSMGLLAGVYIGFGVHAFLQMTSVGETAFEANLAKLFGAALFPVGLMLVIMCGAELFTGNNLLTLALVEKKITPGAILKSWVVVYLANFAGSVLMALFLSKSGLYTGAAAERAIAVAVAKTSAPFGELLIRGILCNILVVLACWLQAGAKDIVGKIFAIWFPITLFAYAGFEHCIANMTYISLGMMLGAEVTVGQFLIANLLPVTIGNMIGGAVVIPGLYYLSLRQARK